MNPEPCTFGGKCDFSSEQILRYANELMNFQDRGAPSVNADDVQECFWLGCEDLRRRMFELLSDQLKRQPVVSLRTFKNLKLCRNDMDALLIAFDETRVS
ncbi:hypothetical protein JW752_03245 [Candidatus Peregrinibacteria bacterium]|nr:hypothetical protein [Candidatus Peregrinibacteria bacterium]